jgi:hypothetical protein
VGGDEADVGDEGVDDGGPCLGFGSVRRPKCLLAGTKSAGCRAEQDRYSVKCPCEKANDEQAIGSNMGSTENRAGRARAETSRTDSLCTKTHPICS